MRISFHSHNSRLTSSMRWCLLLDVNIEFQLAYAERNTVRAAYNRAQRLAEWRVMMQNWADYLGSLKVAPDSSAGTARNNE